MRWIILYIISILICNCSYTPALENTNSNVNDFNIIDAYKMSTDLGKGINLGNALEAYPDELSWGNPIKDEYFRLIKQAGFNTVRIPIRWSTRALPDYPYTISNNFFQRVDHVINMALSNNLNVIINIHHYDELYTDPINHKTRFLELWRQISYRYKNMPSNVLFEILNEPYGNLENYWTDFMTNAIKVIRENNPKRIIIVGGINWNSIDGLTILYLPNDPYIIAKFHFYEPYLFTHQGSEWGGSVSRISNIKWPGPPLNPIFIPDNIENWISNWIVDYNTKKGDENPCSSNYIIRRLDIVSNWSSEKNIPVWLGEFGVYGKYADINSRVRWTHFVRRECEKRGINWCYWEFSAGFGIYNPITKQWNIGLSNALLSD